MCVGVLVPRLTAAHNALRIEIERSPSASVRVVAVGRLLETAAAAVTDCGAAERLSAWGVASSKLPPLPPRPESPKRSKKQHRSPSSCSGSGSVWVTGFLRLRGDSELLLADGASSGCCAHVLAPEFASVDQLVLVKNWTLVDPGDDTDVFMEIHEPLVVLESDETRPSECPSRADVRRLLDAQYATQDPPLYSGALSWRAASAMLQENENVREGGKRMGDTTLQQHLIKRTRKPGKSRVHVAFGRVVCVSPVSANPHDRSSNAHFFVEVEEDRARGQLAQSLVNVMFVGANVRWHQFLWPGQLVLITDLTKVFSRECDVFLLQTTALGEEDTTARAGSAQPQLGTQVFMWRGDSEVEETGLREDDQVFALPEQREDVESYEPVRRPASGVLEDCEGVVARVLWNGCLEVLGSPGFLVCVFHFPSAHLKRIRAGATVRIVHAHVLRWSTPLEPRVVLGFCARSHLSVIKNGELALEQSVNTSGLLDPTAKQRRSKILSGFGDRHTQPLPISLWLFETFEALVTKFAFGPRVPGQTKAAAFQHVRRREALRVLVETLNVDVVSDAPRHSATLGNRFLRAHTEGVDCCPSVRAPAFEQTRPRGHMTSLRQLKEWSERQLVAHVADDPLAHRGDGCWRLQISADELEWCLLVGCISGSVDSGDLEICDQTESVALSIVRGSSRTLPRDYEWSTHLCVVLRFELRVEVHHASRSDGSLQHALESGSAVTVLRVSCSLDDVVWVPMGGDSDDTAPPSSRHELTVLVTHIDPSPCPSQADDALLSQDSYRHVHGIILPTAHDDESARWLAAERVELLVNTETPHWQLEKYGCYRIKAAIREEDALWSAVSRQGTSVATTTEETSIGVTAQFLLSSEEHVCGPAICFQEWVTRLTGFNASRRFVQGSPLHVYRVEHWSTIEPLVFRVSDSAASCVCSEARGLCVPPAVNQVGLLDLSPRCTHASELVQSERRCCVHLLPIQRTPAEVSRSQLLQFSLLLHFALSAENVRRVKDLLRHPVRLKQSSHEQERSGDDASGNGGVDSARGDDIHRARLYSLVGVVASTKYNWVEKNGKSFADQDANERSGFARKRERVQTLPDHVPQPLDDATRELLCRCQVRDLASLDTIEIQVNVSRFRVQAILKPGSIVEFSKLQGFIARSSYKVFMSWGNSSSARELRWCSDCDTVDVPSDATLYGTMTASTLNELYRSSIVDRTLRRWVVRVVYVSYVVLKRKCRGCHRALQLEKRRSRWVHAPAAPRRLPNAKPERVCHWHEVAIKAPEFEERTRASMSMRCVIDDGSAQADLFLEDDAAWDLFGCSRGARHRLEQVVREHSAELSYFTGQMTPDALSSSTVQDNEYYQNEFRAMITTVTRTPRTLVVFGQRFYRAPQPRKPTTRVEGQASASTNASNGVSEYTSVLTFGKDIQIKTRTVASVQLEARRVDSLHAKSELRQHLDRLRRFSGATDGSI